MSNLRRPLVLGLSTCALLLLSSRGLKRAQAEREAALNAKNENQASQHGTEKRSASGDGEAS